MRGRIIGFDPSTYKGAINGHDGQRYDFVMQSWRGSGSPKVGWEVDFQVDGAQAIDIFPIRTISDAKNPSNFGAFLFSFHGRISRKDYWLKGVLAFGAIAFVLMMIAIFFDFAAESAAGQQEPEPGPFFWLTYLILLYPQLAISAKRWHDRGRSAWFLLIGAIPIVGPIWSFVELGCLPGQPEDNQYGPDPLAHH